MGQSTAGKMRETRDATGRTTIELRDDPPKLLLACCALSVAPLFFFGWEALLFVLANLLVFGSLAGWFQYARRRMRVSLDAEARTLAVESGPRPRVLAFGDVLRARAGPVQDRGGPAQNRVELLLRAGDVLPLYAGIGGFGAEDCRRMAERINAGLGLSA